MKLRASPRALALLLGLAACRPAARELVVGEDACDYCRMAITDVRFGGEIVLSTGRHRTFDSIECLASYLASGADSGRVASVYVSDYERSRLIDAATAVYVRGGSLHSPMGHDLAAFSAGTDPAGLKQQYGGTVIDWAAVQATVAAPPNRGTPLPVPSS